MFKALPNGITASRIVLSFSLIVLANQHDWSWFLLVYTTAIVTDAVDGFLARKLKAESSLGKRLEKFGDLSLMAGPGIGFIVAHVIPIEFAYVFAAAAITLAFLTSEAGRSDLKTIRALLYLTVVQISWLYAGYLEFRGGGFDYYLVVSGVIEIAFVYSKRERLISFLSGEGDGPFGG